MKPKIFAVLLLLSLIAKLSSAVFAFPGVMIASTGSLSASPSHENVAALPALAEFVASLRNGDSQALVGVYVSGVMALPVVQQPSSQPGFVSNENNVLTQFRMASQYGTTGLLAHNYLAGKSFFNISIGQDIVLVYGDGRLKTYRIDDIQRYQALSPNSMYSDFIDLAAPLKKLSSTEVFHRVFGQGNVLVLQTCIQVGSEASWGRIFLIGKEKAELPVMSTLAQRAMGIAAMYQATYASN